MSAFLVLNKLSQPCLDDNHILNRKGCSHGVMGSSGGLLRHLTNACYGIMQH